VTERLAGSPELPDLELTIDGVDQRARVATATLFRDEARRLVSLLTIMTGDRAVAEDLAQEAFMRTHAAWPRLHTPDRAAAYLRSTALNLARSRWRRLRTASRFRPERAMLADGAHEVAERNARCAAVLAAIRSLPTRQRECVILRYYGDLGPEQIADDLGMSVNSVKTHLRRGLATLQGRLADDGTSG
jgi:RNA polymerase sigma-70 factor (sigma-E family)